MIKNLLILAFSMLLILIIFLILKKETGINVDTIRPEIGVISVKLRVPGKVINNRIIKIKSKTSGVIEGIDINVGDLVENGDELLNLSTIRQKISLKKELELINLTKYKILAKQEVRASNARLMSRGLLPKNENININLEIQSLNTELLIAKENLNLIRYDIENSLVISPFNKSIVIEKLASKHEYVEKNDHLLTLAPLDGFVIEMSVDISDIKNLKKGTTVFASSEMDKTKVWKEKIKYISPVISNKNGQVNNSLSVIASLINQPYALYLNQQLDLSITLAEIENVIKIPVESIFTKKDTKKIAFVNYVSIKRNPYLDTSEKFDAFYCSIFSCIKKIKKVVDFKTVLTGIEDFTHIEVISGVNEDDLIILPKNIKLFKNMKVVLNND